MKGIDPNVFMDARGVTFILRHLCRDDRDGTLVLGYELLLLARNRCLCKQGSCCAAQLRLDKLPACPLRPWNVQCWQPIHTAGAPGLGSVWQYYGAGWKTAALQIWNIQPDYQTSNRQNIQRIVHTLSSAYIRFFWHGGRKTGLRNPDCKRNDKHQHYSMTRDVREKFSGSYSTPREEQDIAENSNPPH